MVANSFMQRCREMGWYIFDTLRNPRHRRQFIKVLIAAVMVILLIMTLLMLWWSNAPAPFNPKRVAQQSADLKQQQSVTGYTSVFTLISLADTLLDKPGGYLSNDVMPPSIWMDNMPNWEFGVLVQIRDFSSVLRNDISRSQSQSAEDEDLAIADPLFHFDSSSWLFPATEQEYRKGIKALERYLSRLSTDDQSAYFYARADNLASWLSVASKRLGSLSQRLTNSVGQTIITPEQTTKKSAEVVKVVRVNKTPRLQVDDIFYEARGSVWAMIHLLKAVEDDFYDVLQDKNALVSLRQIIRELEATQATVWSPIILNGSGFGTFANHSLVMASYISRANAAMIDLTRLLEKG